MNQTVCNKATCINNKDGRCSLTNPEKTKDSCLDFEDSTEFFRLKADAIRGTLG